jgi:hypothetical protein
MEVGQPYFHYHLFNFYSSLGDNKAILICPLATTPLLHAAITDSFLKHKAQILSGALHLQDKFQISQSHL